MQTFQLDPAGLKEIRKKLLLRTIPMSLFAAFLGVYITTVNQDSGVSTMQTWPIVIPIVLIAISLGVFQGFKRQRKLWTSFVLTVDGETITRTQDTVPTVTIHKQDLREMVETPQGNLVLKTGKRMHQIHIPKSIQHRDELLQTLTAFGPIQQQSSNSGKWTLLITLASIALMVVFFLSTEKVIVLPTGIILTAGLLWSFFEVQRNKSIDRKTKRGMYIIFLVLFSVVGRLLLVMEVFGKLP